MNEDTQQIIAVVIGIVMVICAFATCTAKIHSDMAELEKTQLEYGIVKDPYGNMKKIEDVK